ncbi:uncharacterized protein LOC143221811 [Lasioglossum baleicum]|uniref:uncharacterized protein LOC143221811 n=1 Tax=Lasioglossum baleicum TaxID=434251 RepID=UPI003FCEAA09
MRSSALFGALVATVACSLLVQGLPLACTCGNLGSGTNPCTCSETVVKAAKLPKPTFYVTPEEINDAAAARSSIVIPGSSSPSVFSNLPSTGNTNPVVYSNNANANVQASTYINGNTDTIAYSGGSSNLYSNDDSNAYNGGSSVPYTNGGVIAYSSSDSDGYSNSNGNGNSDTITITSNNPPVNYAAVTTSDNPVNSNSGCGCSKQISTSLDLEDSSDSNVNIVPSFTPIGDLCYPLPIDSRSGKLIEKTRVTPAYPGKIVCSTCNPAAPYEICINTHSGETTSRMLSGTTVGSNSASFGTPSIGNPLPIGNTDTFGISGSESVSGSRLGTLGNVNSGAFDGSSSAYSGAYSGAFSGTRPQTGAFGIAQSGTSTFGGSASGAFGNVQSGTGTFGGSASGAFGNVQSGTSMFGGSASGAFGNVQSGTSTFGGSASGAFGASRSGLFGSVNSGALGGFGFGKYSSSSTGAFGQSSSQVYGVPSFPFSGPNANTAQMPNGQNQFGRTVVAGSGTSSCFDDDTDEAPVDYSYPQMPADAVSLTLAYKNLRAPNVIYRQGKQFVPEDKLSFGHRTVPNDVNNERKIADIPEERLVTVDRPVVELKVAPPRTVVIGSYDEREEAKLAELEAIERESITQEETVDRVAEGLLTYKDLGYAPVGSVYANPRSYSGIINGEINDSMEEPCGPLGPPIPDYIPGSVIVQQQMTQDSFANSGIGEIGDTRPGACAN